MVSDKRESAVYEQLRASHVRAGVFGQEDIDPVDIISPTIAPIASSVASLHPSVLPAELLFHLRLVPAICS